MTALPHDQVPDRPPVIAPEHRPRVVIVGGGFGGLAAARALARQPVDVALIDRHNYHLFQPLLYQVATAALSPADIAMPIRAILRGQTNATMLLDEVTSVDSTARCVLTRGNASMGYDYLVIAVGSTYSYFGHDDWARNAPGLKTIDDATNIRRHVLMAFEHAETAEDEQTRRRLMTFVLVGAGATGVEMAGALAELARATLACDFRRINPRQARIILVEAGPRALAGYPESLSDFAAAELRRMGVELLLDTPIELVDATGVVAKGQRIDSAVVIWCAGVRAMPVARWLGVPAGKGGTVAVQPDLSVPNHPEIFVIGDAAFLRDEKGHPLPGVAAVAEQEGRYVAELIRRRIAGTAPPAPFHYRDKGMLATIGRSSAVAALPHLTLKGRIAWLLWGGVHIYFLIGFRNRLAVFFNWVWAWLSYARGARLITGEHRPASQ